MKYYGKILRVRICRTFCNNSISSDDRNSIQEYISSKAFRANRRNFVYRRTLINKYDNQGANCGAKQMLDGWEQSKGANIELMVMLLHVKPIVSLKNLEKADENQDNQAE